MLRILNIFLNVIKIFMLLTCFVFTFYIVINNYRRLDKELISSVHNFIPFFLLFILFSINLILNQKEVMKNTFYNITCCLVFIMVLFVIYRTLFDRNMIYYIRLGYDINFNYFMGMLTPIKNLIYLLSISNIILIISSSNINILKENN